MGSDATGQVWFYAGAFAVIYVLTAIALFCNAALIHCALACHRGETPSVGDGFAAALARLPQILGWAFITATVGVALNALESALRNNLGILGSLIAVSPLVAWLTKSGQHWSTIAELLPWLAGGIVALKVLLAAWSLRAASVGGPSETAAEPATAGGHGEE